MSDDKMDAIRDRIRSRRLELGLSLQDLAERTGMSKSTLQRYETGSIKNLPLDKLEILAKALETTPKFLMGWKTNADAEWMTLVDEGTEQTPENKIHDFKVLTLQRLLLLRGCTMNRSIANVFFVEGIGSGGILQDDEVIRLVDEVSNYTEYLVGRIFSAEE
ncbi:helix-turn-helix transcriptional regulator [Fournierella sp.]|uniref:helix-turn-helix domain-containing protein n=1 Tax=Allofournierella sp. TaxID=1940256 RepID=UPI0025C0B711|nr:helix-turn-helix transcriptional regulator [Fournierella sp.]